MPAHDVAPDQGKLLHLLARMCGARHVLELLATLSGPFDLVFLDADEQRSPECLEHVLRLTRPAA